MKRVSGESTQHKVLTVTQAIRKAMLTVIDLLVSDEKMTCAHSGGLGDEQTWFELVRTACQMNSSKNPVGLGTLIPSKPFTMSTGNDSKIIFIAKEWRIIVGLHVSQL